jgi:uncharacterized protein (DUF2345 family)
VKLGLRVTVDQDNVLVTRLTGSMRVSSSHRVSCNGESGVLVAGAAMK